MKKCSTCKEEKPLAEFNKNKTRIDGLQTFCRVCNKKRAKRYYREHHDEHLKTIYKAKRKKLEKNQQRFYQFLAISSCAHCGDSNPLVLECDHLSDKKLGISTLLAHYSWDAIEKELTKCQILCASCHSIKTHKENNSYRYRYYMGL